MILCRFILLLMLRSINFNTEDIVNEQDRDCLGLVLSMNKLIFDKSLPVFRPNYKTLSGSSNENLFLKYNKKKINNGDQNNECKI